MDGTEKLGEREGLKKRGEARRTYVI